MKLYKTYIRILGQLYTRRGTSHLLNRTSDFYQESSPGQVTFYNIYLRRILNDKYRLKYKLTNCFLFIVSNIL